MNKISTENLNKLIANAKSFAIITHRRPDADALSSSLSMYWYLVSIGKKASDIDVVVPNFIDDLSFIPGTEFFKKCPTKENYDLVIVVDCSSMHLLETSYVLKLSNQVICFDHHDTTNITANYSIIDKNAPSCTSIIYENFKCTDKNFLDCIATGIISDTSNLTLNYTSKCKKILDELALLGTDTKYLSSKLFSVSNRTKELTNIAISRGIYHQNCNHLIFCTYLLQSDLQKSEKSLTEVNHKAIIQNLQKSLNFTSLILLIENDKNEFKGSLRTFDSNIDLNDICSRLLVKNVIIKGGGHRYSSGITTTGKPYDIFSVVATEILNYTKNI